MTEPADDLPVIRVSAVVIRNANGRVLTVRKRGTSRFILPGGKREPGETPVQAAVRELAEELAVDIAASRLSEIGTFVASAANERDHRVEAVVFAAPSLDTAEPAAEIAELRWQSVDDSPEPDLAPLLTDHVLPVLRQGRRVTAPAAVDIRSDLR